ncbi:MULTISPECIES: CHC2 zinc finger domain-containing protein [Arsenophonus]|uniref:CHC2 zinc finger domain-containing protein n=1 Tax=Arsenophonus apicola TaxID=2879119 RepID=A0ABY8P2T4_9GAMM|nr:MULTISPECIES: CHC2 zinc finger domain-containing protein [Arsenophonus]WGL98591.1 CHC2 zinc finger domain-containing protein [Arsenophonus sp. aPb]WGO83821.1 CHC2 zinc finger domain-containing protein [Arsenophonus apicola]
MLRCPFQDENTPSMVINPTKNLYHCLVVGDGFGD